MRHPASDVVSVPEGESVMLRSAHIIPCHDGHDVLVRCAASGSPNPGLVWLGPGGQHLGRGLSLLVTGTRGKGGNMVTCQADNGIGDKATQTFNIVVTCEYTTYAIPCALALMSP